MEKSKYTFNDFLEEQLKDPNVKAEYDALEPEFTAIEATMKARIEMGVSRRKNSRKKRGFRKLT